ncbi:hypothetical protein B0H12DRAFT_1067205 [Mycena haematopus]|nr:hypothetical protein B0H12DRAFT_1067205 [Mycena haematopus]
MYDHLRASTTTNEGERTQLPVPGARAGAARPGAKAEHLLLERRGDACINALVAGTLREKNLPVSGQGERQVDFRGSLKREGKAVSIFARGGGRRGEWIEEAGGNGDSASEAKRLQARRAVEALGLICRKMALQLGCNSTSHALLLCPGLHDQFAETNSHNPRYPTRIQNEAPQNP